MIILGIILFLIFYPKFSQNGDYATSISLNCPREITFELGDEIVLPENYISVKPAEMINELKVEIYTKTTRTDPNNLKLNHKNISANSTGFYYIKFIVPGKNYDIYDTLVAHVVEKGTLNFVSTKQTIIQNNKETPLSDLYAININNPYNIICLQDNVKIENNNISTTTPTSIRLSFIFDFEFYKYVFNSNLISANTLVPDPIEPPVITPPEDPIEPEVPTEPEDPETPVNPEIPVEPEQPTEPEDPIDPEEPTEPEDPENPNDPETPTDPENPTTPETPTDPEDPTEPETPTDPEEPDNPSVPEDPTIPEENGYTIEIINYDSENITFAIDNTKTKFKLHYEVLYNGELCYYQAVTAQPSDPTMCNVTCDTLYIYIEYIGIKGTFTLTISYGDLATKTLTITFE